MQDRLEKTIRQYSPMVYRLACARAGNRQDADEFYEKMRNNRVKPLKELTEDIHYHTIVAKNTASIRRIEKALLEKGYLMET